MRTPPPHPLKTKLKEMWVRSILRCHYVLKWSILACPNLSILAPGHFPFKCFIMEASHSCYNNPVLATS